VEQDSTNCPICDGTGWKTISAPGEVNRVSRCDCKIHERNRRLFEKARIPKRYAHCTLAGFETAFESPNDSLAGARLAAVRFVENYPLQKKGLLITGPVGTGKTHLVVGIIKELVLEKGIHCVFYDYREFLKEIQNSYNPTVQATELEIMRPICDVEILVLDGLGSVKPSEWVWDTVSYVLNYRYNENKTTLITTNFSDSPSIVTSQKSFSRAEAAKAAIQSDSLGDRITDRMRSRLHEMCRVIALAGIDFRSRSSAVSSRY
jgi:DNA replication protein DnaC